MPLPTEETSITVTKPGQAGPDVVNIITQTSEQLTKSYERLKWIGFTSASGALVILVTFISSLLPVYRLDFRSQVLYAVAGFVMLLLSAGMFMLQNVHAFRLEAINRSNALRSLELSHERTLEGNKPQATLPGPGYSPPTA